MKLEIEMDEPTVEVRESFMRPDAEYPHGSYLRIVAGNVEMATGRFEKEHPGHPSPYIGGLPPLVMFWSESHDPEAWHRDYEK